MRNRPSFACRLVLAPLLLSATFSLSQTVKPGSSTSTQTWQGPCDIYGAANTPCVAAHSTTRALYASYNGPLYQVKRQSDSKTLDIGLLPRKGSDSGRFVNAAEQDKFCANTLCFISVIYDQSEKGNHLLQAAPGTFKGPDKGAFNPLPIADMAPITISGHKAYGVYVIPGMGFRNNNAAGLAVNDEPEGIYYVVDGTHYDSGCCFDYGNSSTNGRAVGTGTMETTYFGTSTVWGRGNGPGPWIMTDLEAGLFSGQDAKQNVADPTIHSWRFVTAVMDGGGGNKWDLRGGDAQKGNLTTFYSGPRPRPGRTGGYYPMHKQGGLLLGTGGDNGNGSSGTFYEGVMTSGYPSETTTDAVQANIVAARYDTQRIALSRVTTFTPGSAQEITASFTNTTGAPVAGLKLSLSLPNKQWTSVVAGATGASKTFPGPIAPGATQSVTFKVTSPTTTGVGFVAGTADWTNTATGMKESENITARLRNVLPIKINEARFSTSDNPSNQFVELYNASDKTIDLSGWRLVNTPSQWASVRLAAVPAGTTLAGHSFYLLGLSGSGLSAPSAAGATEINVRSTSELSAGQSIDVDGEARTIAKLGTPSEASTTLFIPVSTGPWLTIPAGSSNIPVTNATGFEKGQKIGIDLGGHYEVATVTAVGKAATQTVLATAATAGAKNIKLASTSDITVGDVLTIGTGSLKETAKVSNVGSQGETGSGIELSSPLRFNHMATVDVSDPGTGITFSPSTKFSHTSGEAVQALGSGITLDKPLERAHEYGAPVSGPAMHTVGFQDSSKPNLWFGGALSTTAGSLALLDQSGAIVDAIVYGSQQSNSSGNGTITSPELATLEGVQDKGGCIVVTPVTVSGFGTSVGRSPDGADADSNCTDFLSQAAANLSAPISAGGVNIKVSNVAAFKAGQKVVIGMGSEQETATIATVGTAGSTTTSADLPTGSTVIPVTATAGFAPGQTINFGSGADLETAVIAFVSRRGPATITVASPVAHPYVSGTQVAGSGITLAGPLKQGHAAGTPLASDLPTPGAANKYDTLHP